MIASLFIARFRFKRLLPWLLLALLLGAGAVVLHLPAILPSLDLVRGEMPELFTLFGFFGQSNLPFFVMSYLFGLLMPLLTSAFAISSARAQISLPLEDGRMALLLPAGHRRSAILFTLSAVMQAGNLLIVLSAFLGQLAASLLLFPGVALLELMQKNAAFAMVCSICPALTLLLAVTSDSLRAMKRKGRLLLYVSLFLMMASRLPGWVRQLRYLSFWSLFEGIRQSVPGFSWLLPFVALGITTLLLCLSLWSFSKREM